MKPLRGIFVFLNIILLFGFILAARQPVATQKSKLCGNLACEEVLFKSRVKRVMGVNSDPNFLKLTENAIIDVTAVKFSDRFDIMEGKMADGSRGYFYAGAIDITPYAEFLRSAIEEKKEMLEVSQNIADIGEKKLIGVVHSETHLVRDYNAKAAEAASINGLPPPTPLPIPQPPSQGHGHSHGGHGHSHGSHGHSHGSDGHSHTEPVKTAPVPEAVPPKVEEAVPVVPVSAPVVPAVPVVPEPEKKDNSQEIHLNNVLGQPPVLPPQGVPVEASINNGGKQLSMEEEIEMLVRLDTEKLEKAKLEAKLAGNEVLDNKVEDPIVAKPEIVPVQTQTPPTPPPQEEVTQPPLVMTSLPVVPQVVPQVVPEVVKTQFQDQFPQEVTTAAPQVIQQEVPVPVVEPTITPPPVEDPVVQNAFTTTPPPPVVNTQAFEHFEHPPVDPVQVTPAPVPVPVQAEIPEAAVVPPVVPSPIQAENSVVPDIASNTPSIEAPVVEGAIVPPQVEAIDDLKGTCFKDECEGLQKTETVAAEKVDNFEDDFKKWEAERKNDAKPYEDAYGDRFKDLGTENNHSNGKMPNPPSSSGILDLIRSSFGLGSVSDSSVVFYVNITFVVASVLVFGIFQVLPSSAEPEKFDRMAYFNLATKHKELEMQLNQKNVEIQRIQSLGAQQQHAAANDQEVLTLRHQLHQFSNDLQVAQAQRAEFEGHCHQWRESSDEKQREIQRLVTVVAELEEKMEKASNGGQEVARELDGLKQELNESQKAVLARNEKIVELTKKSDDYQSNLQKLHAESNRWKNEFEEVERLLANVEIELKQAKIENASLVEAIQQFEKNQEGGSAAESGGSGWSDFGDNDEIESEKKKEEKTPEASQNGGELADVRAKYLKYGEDMEEFRRLKDKLDEVEKELVKFKSLYEQKETESSNKDLKLKTLEREVAEARKKVEEMEGEKSKTAETIQEMFKTLNNSMNKSSDQDKLVATLREEGFAKEKQLFEAEVAGRKKDDKIRETEAALNRLKLDYTKLETKSFHDVMHLKKKLDDLQTSQILGSSTMPLAPRDLFNSSDIAADRRATMGSPLDNPIWDDDEFAAGRGGVGGQEDYFPGNMTARRRSTRRSGLMSGIGGENSPSDREDKSKPKKEHRRRSRSHGRQMQYNDPFSTYVPPSSDSSFMSHGGAPGFPPLTGRHSKSGHLHYSSGGSNGGRSPPPEMPKLSAIPPPGVRKPPSKRMDPTLLNHHHHGK